MEEWKKLYSGLNLDKKYMMKSIGNPEIMKRDMVKRNEKIRAKIKCSSQVKVKVKT